MQGRFEFDQGRANQINTTEAQALLSALRHPGEGTWVQTFADGPDDLYVLEKKRGKNGRPYLLKKFKVSGVPAGNGKTCAPMLRAENWGWADPAKRPYVLENLARCGVFFAVNVLAADAPRRKAEHVTRVAAVFLDLDGAPMPSSFPLQATATVESSTGRHHVYWAVDGVSLEEFSVIQKHLAGLYGADRVVHDLPRVMRLPGYWHGKSEGGELVKLTSLTPEAQYTRADLLEAWPSLAEALAAAEAEQERQQQDAERRREEADQLRAEISTGDAGTRAEVQQQYGRVGLLACCADLLAAPVGQRKHTLNAVAYRAGRLVGAGVLEESEARAELEAVALRIGLEAGETATTLSSGLEAGRAKPVDAEKIGQFVGVKRARVNKALELTREKAQKAPAEAGAIRYTVPDLPRGTDEATDEANALILSTNGLAARLRYVFGIGWYIYNLQRGTWERDDRKLILAGRVAGPVLRAAVGNHAAALLKRNARDEELEPVLKWRKDVGQNWAINGALTAASGLPAFFTYPDQWDARPDLLNCRNGVLELTTGALRPHDPDDLMTWQAGASYDPTAEHDCVERLTHLLKLYGRNDFLQGSTGSTLYGEAPNETATVLSGPGGTGKGTLITAVMKMLGDYAAPLLIESLLATTHGESGSGPKPEVMDLRGKRLVVAGEPPKGGRFNAGKVKSLTGNDIISARGMRSDLIVKFKPVFKLWIHTNFPINTPHDDTGMQRRLKVVPFNAKPDREEPAFKSTLEHDPRARSALLNWAYEGFKQWYASGFDLGMSAEIEAATGSYWTDQNPYEKFAASCLIFGDTHSITSARLKHMFEEWAEENGAKMGRAVKMADLYAYLAKLHQCEAGRTSGVRVWFGVAEADGGETDAGGQDDTTDTSDTISPVQQPPTHMSELNLGNAVSGVSGVTKDNVLLGQPAPAAYDEVD